MLVTCWNPLVASNSLQNLLVTRCRSWSLQKKSFVTRSKKITRCLLRNSLVAYCRSCLLQKITRYLLLILLVTCRRSYSCKIFLITRWKIRPLLVAKNYLILVAEVARCKVCLLLVGDVAPCNKLLVTSYKKKLLKANKDTIWKFSNPYLANVPTESHTLNTHTIHIETIQVIVIKKLIDLFWYKYKNLDFQWIHQ